MKAAYVGTVLSVLSPVARGGARARDPLRVRHVGVCSAVAGTGVPGRVGSSYGVERKYGIELARRGPAPRWEVPGFCISLLGAAWQGSNRQSSKKGRRYKIIAMRPIGMTASRENRDADGRCRQSGARRSMPQLSDGMMS